MGSCFLEHRIIKAKYKIFFFFSFKLINSYPFFFISFLVLFSWLT